MLIEVEAPAGDHPGVDVDAEGDVAEPDPGRDVGEVHDPQLVGPFGGELTLHEVLWPCRPRVRTRGAGSRTADRPGQSLGAHQPFHGAPRHRHALSVKLAPHLASPIDPVVVRMDPANLLAQLPVANRPGG